MLVAAPGFFRVESAGINNAPRMGPRGRQPSEGNEVNNCKTAKFCWSVFRGLAQNYTNWRSPVIWGNFSKICFKIIKNMKNYGENFRHYENLSRKY